MKRFVLIVCFLLSSVTESLGWGFFAHKEINKHAVFLLPPGLFPFYKHYIHFISEQAVNPDKRRYAVEGEAPRHFIDIDYYGENAIDELPRHWPEAVATYSEELLTQHGILPWHLYRMKHALTQAFREKNTLRILRLSADLGHYVADAHVPLHTSQNYNGQLTDQEGIHAFWETRLPELFFSNYDLWTGSATYIPDPLKSIWEIIAAAHQEVNNVLVLEKKLSEKFPASKKYSFEQRGSTLQRGYARAYAEAYHEMLNGQVEKQLRASIKMVADFWLTCWVDAGQPKLGTLLTTPLAEGQLQEQIPNEKTLSVRTCED